MSPFKSITGRALGKLLEGYKSSDIGKGFGSGGGGLYTASGGTVELGYACDARKYFAFIAPGAFLITGSGTKSFDILVVGGGGQGGNGPPGNGSGGAGSGGIAFYPNVDLSAGTYNIVVGDGGTGNTFPQGGAIGGDSTFGTSSDPYYVIAKGGGGGQSQNAPNTQIGGSGGGGVSETPGNQPTQNSHQSDILN